MRITNEMKYEDGGYVATVESYWNLRFTASYIMDEVRISGQPGNPRVSGKNLKIAAAAAKKLATARIAEFGPDFRAAHLALYADELAAKAKA